MLTWEVVCNRVLKTKLSVWEEFFQQHFIVRAKVSILWMTHLYVFMLYA